MPEDEAIAIKVEEVEFEGKMIGTMDGIRGKVSQIPFYSAKSEGESLVIAKVESRNIQKKPYLFHMIIIKDSSVRLVYSTPQDSSISMRRALVLKNLASIMSMISTDYQINQAEFFQYIDSVMDSVMGGLSQNYTQLYNKYDSLLVEYRELKRLNLELSASNRNLSIQTAQLSEEEKGMKEQLDSLQKYSDEALMALVEEWLEVHGNAIDLEEFSKTYSISIPRVEQILNRMVSMGYIELKS
ncbi:MAG: hypothetical protein KGI00_04360 [Candidatus Micrarchaeota archaeon]|nr:hypothetical protein [Candidatus Micrarchaeota archaeon]MDE1824042.1 hypothetical protein [Candidatus Micrarchaeota archaeon]MDE1849932.1 hypothetical protein [Candidatus Micrarchaeota archaeon]